MYIRRRRSGRRNPYSGEKTEDARDKRRNERGEPRRQKRAGNEGCLGVGWQVWIEFGPCDVPPLAFFDELHLA